MILIVVFCFILEEIVNVDVLIYVVDVLNLDYL